MKNLLYFVCYLVAGCVQLQAIPKDIDFSPLTRIAGKPFYSTPASTSVSVHDENIHGDAVGVSYFSEATEGLWYWNAKTGFQIIATSESVPRIKKRYFQFYQACINDKGTVACSYLDGLVHNSNGIKEDYQYPWIWWTKEGGIHTVSPSAGYQLVSDINNQDYVLINGIGTKSFTITNLHNLQQVKGFDLGNKIHSTLQAWAIGRRRKLGIPLYDRRKLQYSCAHWNVYNESLTEDLQIKGNVCVSCIVLASDMDTRKHCCDLTLTFEIDAKSSQGSVDICVEKEKVR